jgi:hypothetical protein
MVLARWAAALVPLPAHQYQDIAGWSWIRVHWCNEGGEDEESVVWVTILN